VKLKAVEDYRPRRSHNRQNKHKRPEKQTYIPPSRLKNNKDDDEMVEYSHENGQSKSGEGVSSHSQGPKNHMSICSSQGWNELIQVSVFQMILWTEMNKMKGHIYSN
jgi:hypothetical protein